MTGVPRPTPLFRKVDAIEVAVPTLDEGLAWYRDRLGHELLWRRDTSAGLRLGDSDSELVLQADRPGVHVDLLVDSADDAAREVEAAGGRIVTPPFDIPIGRCVAVEDPWGNRLVLLDMRNGPLVIDGSGTVIERDP